MQLLPTRLILLIQFIEILSGTSLMKFLVALSVYLLFPIFYQIYLIMCISCIYCTALQCTILYANVLCCAVLYSIVVRHTSLHSTAPVLNFSTLYDSDLSYASNSDLHIFLLFRHRFPPNWRINTNSPVRVWRIRYVL